MRLSVEDYYNMVSDIISEEDFFEKLEKYNKEFSDLIEKDVLAHLVVDELGRNFSNYLSIAELKPGTRASLFTKVTKPEPSIFIKHKGSQKAAEVNISDPTGVCRLLLWDPVHVELIENETIKEGIKLKLINAKIMKSSYGTGIDISLDKNESLIISPKDFPEQFEDKKLNFSNINSINYDGAVNIVGTIAWIGPLRKFYRKNNTEGYVLNLDIYDGTGTIRITLWDEHAKAAEKLQIGTNLKIINGFSKINNSIREIHSNFRTQIIMDDH